jgi:DNA-binding NtrC family response regulator
VFKNSVSGLLGTFTSKEFAMATHQTDNSRRKILVIDDNRANRNLLGRTLEAEDYDVSLVPSGEIGLSVASRTQPDLILLDVIMPNGIDGFEACQRLKASDETAEIPVLFITAKDDTESVVKGFQLGGVDYITKPFSEAEVLARVETHLKINRLTRELKQKNSELQAEIDRRRQAEDSLETAGEQLSVISAQEASRLGIPGFVTQNPTVVEIFNNIHRLHDNDTISVLITGESGTGKEMVARALHHDGTRADAPFFTLNCSAIPTELAESTLFGHIRGAFTGATANKKGYFELANKGTLFLLPNPRRRPKPTRNAGSSPTLPNMKALTTLSAANSSTWISTTPPTC